ncbi:sensor histidine kinase [Streptacidiphilus sp. MAP12-33]|uniref:sensor histidine kinase n=1 Tax=Streptacidiphilus sp. MAP12-33 TaxID=3156266 RepID=UPI003511E7A0
MRFVPVLPADPAASPGGGGPGLLVAEALAGGVVMVVTYAVLHSVGQSGTLGRGTLLLLGCGALALLVGRRRFPQAAMLGQAALVGVMPAASMLCAIVCYSSTRRCERARRRDVLLGSAAVLPVVVCLLRVVVWQDGRWQYAAQLGVVLAAVTVLVPGLVGTAAGQQDRLVLALRERTAAAEQARRLAESESRIHERSRIAAEMHDLVGHRLSLIALHAGGLEMALGSQAPELREEAAQVRRAGRDAMDELRQVLGVLGPLGRDTGTDALTDATGTRSDVLALVEESRAAGVPVEYSWEGEDLDAVQPRVRRAVNRVVRESLTNVHRYAPGAPVWVTVRHLPERIELRVRNGPPSARPAATSGLGTGRGLTGLGERVALLGGELTAGPSAQGGFQVEATVPTDPDQDGAADRQVRESAALEGLPAIEGPVRRQMAGVVSAALGLAGLGAILLLGLAVVQEAHYYNYASAPPPDSLHLGMSFDQVTALVGGNNDAVSAAAAGREPDRAAGTTRCIFPYTSATLQDRLQITRYCFAGNVLTDISHFSAPLAHDAVLSVPVPSA